MCGTNEFLEQFISDAEDLIDASDEALIHLELREGDPDETMAGLMRSLHTLKGTAAFFDLPLLSSFSHFLEDMVQPFREKKEFPDSDTVVNLFSGVTILRQMFDVLREGRGEDEFEKEIEEFKEYCQVRKKDAPDGSKKAEEEREGENDLQEKAASCKHGPGAKDKGPSPKSSEEGPTVTRESEVPQVEGPKGEEKQPSACLSDPKPRRHSPKRSSDPFLKIRSQKVDELMDLVAEFGVALAEVLNHPELRALEIEGLEEKNHQVEVLLRQLQDVTAGLRLVPVSTLFRPMQRLVRDLSRATGKNLRLKTQGDETELDKVVVESLHDPLVHMIRNAGDHGIEPFEERVAAGKPGEGTILLKASQRGGEVVIEVIDDGKGLSRESILRKAREHGLVGAEEEPEDRELWQYIFHPGFSTAEKVTSVSGRGVGMDVVNAAVKEVRGRTEIESTPGKGTRVAICIPLTLAFLDSMVVEHKDIRYAIPTENVVEILRPERDRMVNISADRSETVRVREDLIPVLRLEQFYHMDQIAVSGGCPGGELLVIVRSEKRSVAIPVDSILGQQQVTIKPLQGYAKDIRAGAGWALLGSGETALVLDCMRLEQAEA